MRAHELPVDVATEIYGTIECVVADHLRMVVQYVEAAWGGDGGGAARAVRPGTAAMTQELGGRA